MAFVHECSSECAKTELDLFTVADTQTSLESAAYCEYHPVTSITDGASIEFDVSGTGEDYLDLNNTMLHVKAKIVQEDGTTAIPADDVIAPVNYLLHAMFQQVEIYLNGTQISNSNSNYPYRAIIEALLSYGGDSKKTQMAAAGFESDQADRMDSVLTTDAGNAGFKNRKTRARESRVFDMIGRLHADIFFQDRYLLNDVNLKIVLIRSKDAFCLMGTNARKLVITSATLLVRKVRVSPSVALGHAKALEIAPAKYPIRRVVCKSFTSGSGVSDIIQEKLYSGQLPVRIVIGLVDNAGFHGSLTRNPFNFAHFNLSEIGVYLDGLQGFSIKPLKLDYANDLYIEAYMNLFHGTGKINRDEGNCITPADFKGGFALYAYDLSPDLCEGDHFNLLKQGAVRLTIRFSTALVRPITVVSYAEFENVIEIDRSRNIIFDFSS